MLARERYWAAASRSAEFQTVATVWLLGHSSRDPLSPLVPESSRPACLLKQAVRISCKQPSSVWKTVWEGLLFKVCFSWETVLISGKRVGEAYLK